MVLYLREAMRAIASLGCEGAMSAIASSMSPHVSSRQGPTPIFSAATAGGRTTVQTVSAAAKTLPTTPLVKSKSPEGSRVTVQIEQYFPCSAAQLTSFSSPAATASRLASSMLPHVSQGASQLLKPASTTPRSYGRRHRSWHYEPQAQKKTDELFVSCCDSVAAHFKHAATRRPRRKPTVETSVDNTAKLLPQASVLAPRPCTCNAQ